MGGATGTIENNRYHISVAVSLVSSADPCAENLVTGPFGVPDDHITASSHLNGNIYAGPERGRLNTTANQLANGTYLQGSWSPTQNSKNEYIQVELNDYSLIRGVMTQGRNVLPSENDVEYVASYHVETSMDGKTFTRMTDSNGKDKVFRGNIDSDTIESSSFACPVFAKYVRIIPEAWSQNISLRFDLMGCQIDQSKKVPATTSPPATTQAQTTQNQQTTAQNQQTTAQNQQTTAQNQQTSGKAALTTAAVAANAAKVTTNAATTSAAPAVATLAQVACVPSCVGKPNGDYQECSKTKKSCEMQTYVTCSNGIMYAHRPCPAGLFWNDQVKRCGYRLAGC